MQRTLLIVGAGVISVGGGLARYPILMVIVSIPCLFIGFAITFLALRRTPCPVCHARLGAAMRRAASEKPTVNKCPHCDVSFDTEMPAAR
jgi:hypothetical protein